VLTPHVGSATENTLRKTSRLAVDSALDTFAGERRATPSSSSRAGPERAAAIAAHLGFDPDHTYPLAQRLHSGGAAWR
jgi:hypothetical protein